MAAQKIMICDDQIMIHETLGMYLENEGYEHISAMDGEEALQKFETEKPDLIILDIMMPKLSGTDVCRKLRGKKPRAYNNANGKGRRDRPDTWP